MNCPLCSSEKTNEFQAKSFYRCPECALIFKDLTLRLDAQEERQRYDLHENSIDDPRYVQFLSPSLQAIKKLIPAPARGLDYGSGPSPVLAELLKRENYDMTAYDPFFSPLNLSHLKPFDFIVSTEVIEHFYHPNTEFQRLFSLLKPNAFLILRTEFFKENTEIQKWHYVRDPTHVCFYSEKTMKWLAQRYQRAYKMLGPTLCIFAKSDHLFPSL